MTPTETCTAADLRAAIARARMPLYILAGRIRLHPTYLSKIVNGHLPMRPDLVARIMQILNTEHRA